MIISTEISKIPEPIQKGQEPFGNIDICQNKMMSKLHMLEV